MRQAQEKIYWVFAWKAKGGDWWSCARAYFMKRERREESTQSRVEKGIFLKLQLVKRKTFFFLLFFFFFFFSLLFHRKFSHIYMVSATSQSKPFITVSRTRWRAPWPHPPRCPKRRRVLAQGDSAKGRNGRGGKASPRWKPPGATEAERCAPARKTHPREPAANNK